MKKGEKIVKYFLFSITCFILVNGFTYIFSYLELGFKNLITNLIINNLVTFFAVFTVILVREIKFFSVEDAEEAKITIAFGFISGFALCLPEISWSLSTWENVFLIFSLAMTFLFSMIHLKFGIINAVSIVAAAMVLRFFFQIETILENYFYFSAAMTAAIILGAVTRIFFSFFKKIRK